MTQPSSKDVTQYWRPQAVAPSRGVDLVAQVGLIVAQRPDAIAVITPRVTLTYAQLWARAMTLARRLRAATISPGDPVALCLSRSAELVVGTLGILAAGGYYVALDPAQPEERLRFMVHDSGAQLVVTDSASTYGLPADRVVAPPAGDEYAGALDTPPLAKAEHCTPAYVVYTSGSTGTPKGVLVEHASLRNLVEWHQSTFSVGPADRTTLLASPGFDASVWEIWPCLTAGATLLVPAEELKTDPGALRDWLVAEAVTVSFLPTPLAEAVMALDWPPDAALRLLLTGGDVLHRRPPQGLPFTLVNNYGVSEAAVVSTSAIVPPADPAHPESPSIGSAISGVTVEIVNGAGRTVPPGDVGELVICGVAVARGYIGRPEGTAEQFSTGDDGVRSYRTGDLVRARADGELEYLGRIDDQVQLRGFRVELDEVVAVLNQDPTVRSSAVVAVSDDANGDVQFLRAFLVATPGSQPDAGYLRQHLATQLPEHMVPRDVITLAALPTTANGKLDRKALLNYSPPAPAMRDEQVAPRNDTERSIAALVAERLGMPDVGVEENFFLLGGHSMLGAQLIIRLSEQFGVEMSLRTLFEHPTVAEMAVEVERLVVEDIATMTEEELLAAAQLDGEMEP